MTVPEPECAKTPPDSEFSASMLALLPKNQLKRKSAFNFGASPKGPSQSPLNDLQAPNGGPSQTPLNDCKLPADGASLKRPSQTPLDDSQVANGASPKRPSQSPSLKQPTSQSPLNDSQVPDGYYFDDAKTLILGDATPSQDVDMIDKNENISPGGALMVAMAPKRRLMRSSARRMPR